MHLTPAFHLFLLVNLAWTRNVNEVPKGRHPSDQDHLNLGPAFAPKMMEGADGSLRAVEDSAYWNSKCQDELAQQLSKAPIVSKAKNVIFFLGDGTGIATLTAARMLKGFRTGNFEEEQMAWETFPYSSIIKTYNTNMQVTDSAASATAYLSGVKANQATIGVDANVQLNDCVAMNMPQYHTEPVLKNFQLLDDGRSTGIVTLTRVTHASPAGNYAHTAERHWENDDDINDENGDSELCDDIAEQLVLGDTGSKIKVILGGGRQKFLPKDVVDPEGGDNGRRDDGENLIETWINSKSILGPTEYVWNRTNLLTLDTAKTDYLMGLFDYSHMAYAVDKDLSNPSLQEMTKVAIEVLQRDDNGFFLFVEGGLIDKAHHLNEHSSALEEAVEFEKAVQTALDMTSEQDTLIIVTADHSQPMTINGYPAKATDIRGIGGVSDVDGLSFTTLMYSNGPGYRDQKNGVRPDPIEEGYGYRLRGGDLFRVGIATHFCPGNKVEELKAALLALPHNTQPEHVKALLDAFHQDQHDFSLAPHLKDIKECFTAPTLPQILEKLEKSESDFCRKQLALIRTMSPTSVVITHEQIKRAATLSLQECLKMDFRMVVAVLAGTEFHEGVRARLVDKDNNPKWQPATLEEVDVEATITRHFTHLPPDQELQLRTE